MDESYLEIILIKFASIKSELTNQNCGVLCVPGSHFSGALALCGSARNSRASVIPSGPHTNTKND